MCKFDKNSVYSTREVAEALVKDFPDKKFESVHGTVSSFFTKAGYLPTNKQNQRRVFSGRDCQEVYDHFYLNWSSKTPIEVLVREKSSVYERVSIELRCAEGLELENRASNTGKSKAEIVRRALREYFDNHPFVDLNSMSDFDLMDLVGGREKLIEIIKSKED